MTFSKNIKLIIKKRSDIHVLSFQQGNPRLRNSMQKCKARPKRTLDTSTHKVCCVYKLLFNFLKKMNSSREVVEAKP